MWVDRLAETIAFTDNGNQLKIYALENNAYQEVARSQLLPELDLSLLVRCVQMPSRLEAMRAFRDGLLHE